MRQCWPFFHRYTRWEMCENALYQGRECEKCGKRKIRRVY